MKLQTTHNELNYQDIEKAIAAGSIFTGVMGGVLVNKVVQHVEILRPFAPIISLAAGLKAFKWTGDFLDFHLYESDRPDYVSPKKLH